MSNLERIESIKAGCLGAISFLLSYLIVIGFNRMVWDNFVLDWFGLSLKTVIALSSGFLFAVTYRYIIRNDNNKHLKDGSVFAFGLVRGLVPLEMSLDFFDHLVQLSVLGIESILCFAIVRFSLDFALERHWIKPFLS
ncbi:MAG: hypothetical protein QNJ64_16430 [Crocosphaera sp.]|nr:hypothetical protein [Crocosphaera sp.]